MRREGRQHGTVRTFCILPSSPLNPNGPAQKKSSPKLGSPPTAGIFTRVTTKPTNHSKFTGKCGRARCSNCHLHPSWKSKDKIKGARTKLRSMSDVDLSYGGLLGLRVMVKSDENCWSHYKVKLDSQSASDILYDHYDQDVNDCAFGCYGGRNNQYKYSRRYGNEEMISSNHILNLDSLVEYPFISSPHPIYPVSNEIEVHDEIVAHGFGDIVVDEDDEEDEEDDDMGFFDVAIVWEPIDGDEGWTLVGEM